MKKLSWEHIMIVNHTGGNQWDNSLSGVPRSVNELGYTHRLTNNLLLLSLWFYPWVRNMAVVLIIKYAYWRGAMSTIAKQYP